AVIARRYTIQRKLGNGSFGSVYLVNDKKAKQGEELKVLKEISVGNLKPNETVEANLEAQLLSKLDHPAIVKFYASFVERDSFCIITEYCEGGDLDCKIQEYRDSGKTFTQSQVIDWFIQLLLGVNYMHERRILHRDLKAKNIFLKDNLLKIGDFGVSCLLMGSCDLATTFTGTPYYMSPEVLKHQGYDTKSDIWSLGCILYEMCCMNHAFTGQNFLSVVLKIVEGETPSLPDRYPSKLNAVLCSMLSKDPSLRPAAAEILKSPYIDEQLQKIQYKFTNMTVKDKALNCHKESAPIFGAVQKKVHLQTLQELSEVQKMTPRERMRLRKLNAADERAKKLKQLAEEKYQENIKRMQEFRSRNFQQLNVNVLHESAEQTSKHLIHSQPATMGNHVSTGQDEPRGNGRSELGMSELTDHGKNSKSDVKMKIPVKKDFSLVVHMQIKSGLICKVVKKWQREKDINLAMIAWDACGEKLAGLVLAFAVPSPTLVLGTWGDKLLRLLQDLRLSLHVAVRQLGGGNEKVTAVKILVEFSCCIFCFTELSVPLCSFKYVLSQPFHNRQKSLSVFSLCDKRCTAACEESCLVLSTSSSCQLLSFCLAYLGSPLLSSACSGLWEYYINATMTSMSFRQKKIKDIYQSIFISLEKIVVAELPCYLKQALRPAERCEGVRGQKQLHRPFPVLPMENVRMLYQRCSAGCQSSCQNRGGIPWVLQQQFCFLFQHNSLGIALASTTSLPKYLPGTNKLNFHFIYQNKGAGNGSSNQPFVAWFVEIGGVCEITWNYGKTQIANIPEDGLQTWKWKPIPEDPEIAEEYYKDEFESCSEDSEEEENAELSWTVSKTNHQDSVMNDEPKQLQDLFSKSVDFSTSLKVSVKRKLIAERLKAALSVKAATRQSGIAV
ncbi:hypothetical protein EK904_005230, partial [Melospiza melodia maxima]